MKKNHGQLTGIVSPLLTSIRMKKIFKIVKGGDILDYGCDYGKLLEKLSFETYTGVDLDPTVIAYAKERNYGLKNVNFYTIEEFESIQVQYDYIILLAVIEHFKDPITILKILKNRLKYQGKIVITTPTHLGNNFLTYGSKVGIVSRSAFEEHNRIFSKKDFIDIAKILELNLIEYSTFECGMNQLVVFSHDKFF